MMGTRGLGARGRGAGRRAGARAGLGGRGAFMRLLYGYVSGLALERTGA